MLFVTLLLSFQVRPCYIVRQLYSGALLFKTLLPLFILAYIIIESQTKMKGNEMATIYDVEGELEKLGYDFDALLDELVYQVSNTGVEYEYHDEFYRMGFVGGYGGWTAEEILGECERYDMDLEEYKLEEDEE